MWDDGFLAERGISLLRKTLRHIQRQWEVSNPSRLSWSDLRWIPKASSKAILRAFCHNSATN